MKIVVPDTQLGACKAEDIRSCCASEDDTREYYAAKERVIQAAKETFVAQLLRAQGEDEAARKRAAAMEKAFHEQILKVRAEASRRLAEMRAHAIEKARALHAFVSRPRRFAVFLRSVGRAVRRAARPRAASAMAGLRSGGRGGGGGDNDSGDGESGSGDLPRRRNHSFLNFSFFLTNSKKFKALLIVRIPRRFSCTSYFCCCAVGGVV